MADQRDVNAAKRTATGDAKRDDPASRRGKFFYLFVALLGLVAIYPFFEVGGPRRIFLVFIAMAIPAAGVYAAGDSRRNFIIATALGVASLFGGLEALAGVEVLPGSALGLLFALVFYIFIAGVIVSHVLGHEEYGYRHAVWRGVCLFASGPRLDGRLHAARAGPPGVVSLQLRRFLEWCSEYIRLPLFQHRDPNHARVWRCCPGHCPSPFAGHARSHSRRALYRVADRPSGWPVRAGSHRFSGVWHLSLVLFVRIGERRSERWAAEIRL